MAKDFQLGQALRDLRLQRRLSGEHLGKKAGLSQSKISRIETGTSVNIDPAQIEKILHILDAPQLIRQQVLSVLGEPKLASLKRFKVSMTTVGEFNDVLERESKAELIRMVNVGILPALLQIPEYRYALLKSHDLNASEFQAAQKQIMHRQDMLWDASRRYQFVLFEPVLYGQAATRQIQRAQLDRIERFIGLHNIKLGVIPYQSWSAFELCSFVLYDTTGVTRVVLDADLYSRSPDDIAIYLKLFNLLDRMADYGESARALIHKAVDYFS
jgi:transcriptional regulator with XRE-family HTH domain